MTGSLWNVLNSELNKENVLAVGRNIAAGASQKFRNAASFAGEQSDRFKGWFFETLDSAMDRGVEPEPVQDMGP